MIIILFGFPKIVRVLFFKLPVVARLIKVSSTALMMWTKSEVFPQELYKDVN